MVINNGDRATYYVVCDTPECRCRSPELLARDAALQAAYDEGWHTLITYDLTVRIELCPDCYEQFNIRRGRSAKPIGGRDD